MIKVWLKYRQKGAPLGTTTAMRFNALICQPIDETIRLESDDLNARPYSHLRSIRTQYDLSIGPDELVDATKKAFIDEFWISAQAWLVIDSSDTEPLAASFIEVVVPAGRSPIQPLEGDWSFPYIDVTLISKVLQ